MSGKRCAPPEGSSAHVSPSVDCVDRLKTVHPSLAPQFGVESPVGGISAQHGI